MVIRRYLTVILTACAVLQLLAACAPGTASPIQPTIEAAATQPPANTQPADPTLPSASGSGDLILDLMGVAQGMTVETIAEVPPSAEQAWWVAAPEHRRLTFTGFPVSGNAIQPQILVYPAAELAAFNEAGGQAAVDLQALLQSRQAGEELPFLPLMNAKQVMHAQVQYLDMQNGSGTRYLTQYNSGIAPINNAQLLYTFQGLTSDGKFYISAVLPVTHSELPATDQAGQVHDYQASLTETIHWLEAQPASSFTPDLSRLDAMMQSISLE